MYERWRGVFATIMAAATLALMGCDSSSSGAANNNNNNISTYSISGTVTANGSDLAGVSVSTSGGSATTDANGVYTIAGMANGSYTLTPAKTGYTFTPATLAVTVSSANLTGKDFTAAAVVSGGVIQLPKTGQTTCYDANGSVIACNGTGQDGDKQKGAAWPSPRFIDNANGTATDNLTGLVWVKNADCFSSQTWTAALNSANTLASGACGLSDGSTAGQWRLPNRKELQSLVDRSTYNPTLPTGHPFTGGQSKGYWSSTGYASHANVAWIVHLDNGVVNYGSKTINAYVWPVRAGQ